jgi:hypothetical protein
MKDFSDKVGGFGVLLLLVGKDWRTREQGERSMRDLWLKWCHAWQN